jgi:peptidoglycan/LPS O-acetylase OafA/YrhL
MMSDTDAPVRPARYFELDSLRGLAALIVVLHHLLLAWVVETGWPASVICRDFVGDVILLGPAAVILFFVLSGFVLSLPAVNGKPQTYFTFVTRRVFRIYVPYLAALAVSIAALFWLYGHMTESRWVLSWWSGPVTWRLIWQHVMFLGVYDTTRFDPPIWSLVYEMRISLFFPLLCAIVLRLRMRWAFALAFFLTAVPSVIDKKYGVVGTVPLFDTLHYTTMFILGIYLAREKARIADWFKGLTRLAKISFGVAAVLLFAVAGPQFTPLAISIFHLRLTLFTQWITALGAGGLIIICMNSGTCKRILLWPPIRLLGQMSYSLYLMHFIVLLCCLDLLFGRIPLAAILCLVFVLSLIVSWYCYRWVEVPSMNFGRRLSNASRNPTGA